MALSVHAVVGPVVVGVVEVASSSSARARSQVRTASTSFTRAFSSASIMVLTLSDQAVGGGPEVFVLASEAGVEEVVLAGTEAVVGGWWPSVAPLNM